MKNKAQIFAAALFLLSFIKSFKYSSNAYDVVFITICGCIYLVYEVLSDNKLKADVEKLTSDINTKFKEVEKDSKDTKAYVSTMSLGSTFTKR